MIEANKVSLRYPDGTMALQEFDLKIEPGEIVYITGPSGSGKTSLLKLFMGMEYPTAGSLKVLGQPMIQGQAKNIRGLRRAMGPVFQEFKLINGRTVMENVMLGLRFFDQPLGLLKENALDAIAVVGLSHKVNTLVENLSWGERQRIAIARAVARNPVLILADEPTGNLDKENALNILELLTAFKDKNTSIIITTHATHLIEDKKSDKLIMIDKGNMCLERMRV